MINRRVLDTINNQILTIVSNYCKENNIVATKNISNRVFERDSTNIAVNTTIANMLDIQQLISDQNYQYEDGDLDYQNNILTDGKGLIGVSTLITIDTGNQESSQVALSENGFVLVALYNYLSSVPLPAEWKLYDIILDIPTWFPFHSGNIYSIIEIRGLYELQ